MFVSTYFKLFFTAKKAFTTNKTFTYNTLLKIIFKKTQFSILLYQLQQETSKPQTDSRTNNSSVIRQQLTIRQSASELIRFNHWLPQNRCHGNRLPAMRLLARCYTQVGKKISKISFPLSSLVSYVIIDGNYADWWENVFCWF